MAVTCSYEDSRSMDSKWTCLGTHSGMSRKGARVPCKLPDALDKHGRNPAATDPPAVAAPKEASSDPASAPEPVSREDFDLAIRSCAHRGDVPGAEALVQELLEKGYEMSVETCNFLLNACSQSGDMARAQQYLQQMLKMKVLPNQVTYNSLINGCAMKGDVVAVEAWLRHMIACGIKPNHVTFGTVCKAFARVGDADKVERVMQALEKSGEPLNEYFYASLISACAEAKQAARAERALADLARRGLRPSAVRSAMGRAVGRRRANQLISRFEQAAEAAEAAKTFLPARAPPGLEDFRPEIRMLPDRPAIMLQEAEDARRAHPGRHLTGLPNSVV
mmetsp:Transcript_92751/g.276651  ORF Transcript_92751/g.276651 Transcript_92751/m.276651 type:complete len:335 (+) Transcript_92751:39-1043(+)